MAVSKNVAEDMMNWLEADDNLRQVCWNWHVRLSAQNIAARFWHCENNYIYIFVHQKVAIQQYSAHKKIKKDRKKQNIQHKKAMSRNEKSTE